MTLLGATFCARADIPMLGVRCARQYTGEFCVTLASNPTLHNGRDQGNIGMFGVNLRYLEAKLVCARTRLGD